MESQVLEKPVQKKREDYISWSSYFMSIAYISAQRSKDPSTQVGCCIVDTDNHIVGTGYNGLPKGCSDDEYPWSRDNEDPLENKYSYIIHSEANGILNSRRDTKGCTLYTTLFPCETCAKLIIQAGIVKIIYLEDKYHNQWQWVASRKMLDSSKVAYEQYVMTGKKLEINI